jgi:hypothetical protein
MADESKRIVKFPGKSSGTGLKEKAERIDRRADHVAAQPESYWQLILPDIAAELGIAVSEFESIVVAKREALKKKADDEKAANRRAEERAEEQRRIEKKKKAGDDDHAEPDREPTDEEIEEKRRKHREKEQAFEELKKLSGAARETGLAELAERLGEDPADLLKQFAESSGSGGGFFAREKDVDVLLRLAGETSLFCDRAGVAYADVVVDAHRVTWPLASREMADWLFYQFYREMLTAPSNTALKTALRTLQVRAKFDTTERHEVYLRVAEHGGKIYVDLGEPQWSVVEIDADDWRLADRAPVRFRRPPTMGALPVPERGGSIELLRKYVSLDQQHFVLYVSAILDAFRVRGPHILLLILGREGSTKSTKVRIACHLTDPDTEGVDVDPPGLPTTKRDLFAAAHNARVLPCDNVSSIPPLISNALCRISSGQNVDRKLFTDAEVSKVGGSHPIFVTAINNPITKPDLANRTVMIQLSAMADEERRERVELSDSFEVDRPRILGAIFSAVSHGLRRLPHAKIEKLPRMADFARWATACETAFAKEGDFMAAYTSSVAETVEAVIEDNPVAIAIRAFMSDREEWKSTTTELMGELEQHDRAEAKPSTWLSWPKDPSAFGKALRPLVETLRKSGVEVAFEKATSHMRTREIKLRRLKTD